MAVGGGAAGWLIISTSKLVLKLQSSGNISIGEAVGLTSSSSVHAQLANLERLGLLHKDPTKPRAMTLAERMELRPEVRTMSRDGRLRPRQLGAILGVHPLFLARPCVKQG